MTEQATTPETQPEQAPGLSIQDLLLVVNTIQVLSQRGGFKAEEMSTVGGLYERLVAFLRANGAIRDAAPQAPADAPSAESADTPTEK